MGSTVITDKADLGGLDVTDKLAASSSGEKSSSIMERLMTQALMTWDATGKVRWLSNLYAETMICKK